MTLTAVLAAVGEVQIADNTRTWRSDDARFDVSLFPVLPGDPGCR